MFFDISVWQIVLAVVAYFGIGAVWYSPALFAKPWMKALGKTNEDMKGGSPAPFVATLLAMVVIVLFEAYFVNTTGTNGAFNGAKLGAMLWLGFAATTAFVNSVFQHRSKQLYVIDMGYHLVGFALAGAILAS